VKERGFTQKTAKNYIQKRIEGLSELGICGRKKSNGKNNRVGKEMAKGDFTKVFSESNKGGNAKPILEKLKGIRWRTKNEKKRPAGAGTTINFRGGDP